jgi:hypothetical protein
MLCVLKCISLVVCFGMHISDNVFSHDFILLRILSLPLTQNFISGNCTKEPVVADVLPNCPASGRKNQTMPMNGMALVGVDMALPPVLCATKKKKTMTAAGGGGVMGKRGG